MSRQYRLRKVLRDARRGSVSFAQEPAADRTSADKGDMGETLAVPFLRKYFREVAKPVPDFGGDLLCRCPVLERSHISSQGSDPYVIVQVKSGISYRRGIEVCSNTMEYLIQRMERQPVLFLYYEDVQSDQITPDAFLVLYEWMLAYPNRIRLNKSDRIRIPFSDFEALGEGGKNRFLRTLIAELDRTIRPSRSPFATRYGPIPEYHYTMHFPRVARIWEAGLIDSALWNSVAYLAGGYLRDPQENCLTRLLLRPGHPLERCPEAVLTAAQHCYMKALERFRKGRGFRLSSQFNVVSVAAGRALAAKYPVMGVLAGIVVKNWRNRPPEEVLTALQILAVASHCDREAEGRAATIVRRMQEDVCRTGFGDLRQYQLAHHVQQVHAEIAGNRSSARRAADLAFKHPEFQKCHLLHYGWGIGENVITLYMSASQSETTRGQKLREYNRAMADVMSTVL